mmetsp:Transcript_41709/g.94245  ORF Transcript_41709/g.94245 Transcript_41709/m.94245 type:complete len:219 (+) Transcript_41709:380-1036(+)
MHAGGQLLEFLWESHHTSPSQSDKESTKEHQQWRINVPKDRDRVRLTTTRLLLPTVCPSLSKRNDGHRAKHHPCNRTARYHHTTDEPHHDGDEQQRLKRAPGWRAHRRQGRWHIIRPLLLSSLHLASVEKQVGWTACSPRARVGIAPDALQLLLLSSLAMGLQGRRRSTQSERVEESECQAVEYEGGGPTWRHLEDESRKGHARGGGDEHILRVADES